MRRKLDNRGSAMIIVIIVIAFVSILVSSLFMMSVMNIKMKSVDHESKENFYSAEGALEQITVGLQRELSEVSTAAYAEVMQEYANNTLEIERKQIFNDKLLADLKSRLESGGVINTYSQTKLMGYVSENIKSCVALSSSEGSQLVKEDDSLILKDLEVTYTDADGYQSVIETDIRLTAPNLNLVQPSDMPEVFDYSIVANEKLITSNTGEVNIKANVYAGEYGLQLDTGSVWKFTQASRLVVSGIVNVADEATLSVESDMDLWAKEVTVDGGTFASTGRTYVANDMVLGNDGSTVRLSGEYYGYGNGKALTDAGIVLNAGGDSSAILLNGVNSTLDMSNIRRLLLSGSAQIATGEVTFNEDDLLQYVPEYDPSLNDSLQPGALINGEYAMRSKANNFLVCNTVDYLIARTPSESDQVNELSWERLQLINNEDGTVSFYNVSNPDNRYKYVSVMMDDQNVLKVYSDQIGVTEKFKLYCIEIEGVNYYALKSYANGKFVSLETYYNASGNVDWVLCADRDKVTDSGQLFQMLFQGELVDTRFDPDEFFTFMLKNYNPTDKTYDLEFRYAYGKWINKGEDIPFIPNGHSGWLTYTIERNGSVIFTYPTDGSGYTTTASEGGFWRERRVLSWSVPVRVQKGDIINYSMRYTANVDQGIGNNVGENFNYFSGEFTIEAGHGNRYETLVELNAEGIKETKVKKRYTDGYYYIRAMYQDVPENNGADIYLRLGDADDVNTKDDIKGIVTATKEYHDTAVDSYATFIIQHLDTTDKVVIRSSAEPNYFLSVQEDGSIAVNYDYPYTKGMDIEVIKTYKDAIFQIHHENGEYNYAHLHVPESYKNMGDRFYVNLNQVMNDKVVDKALVVGDKSKTLTDGTLAVDTYRNLDYLRVEWLGAVESLIPVKSEYKDDQNNYNPVSGMTYYDEDTAKTEFTTPAWTEEKTGTVTMVYSINGSPDYVVEMDMDGVDATYYVNGLRHLDRVEYHFIYNYTDASGVVQSATTLDHIYIHERKYGLALEVQTQNEDVNLGESIEVKSNQIAYLVPPDCIGVFQGESLYNKNPISDKEYVNLMAYADNTAQYPGFEIVSFTKEVDGLGKNLDEYRTAGSDGYKTVFVPTSEGTMVYFYVDFDTDGTSAYFRDYYAKHYNVLEAYMDHYVNKILLSNQFTRLTTDGNLVYSDTEIPGRINLHSNENHGGYLTAIQRSSLENEEAGYQKRFKALSTMLMMDYNDLSAVEKQECLFDNLLRYNDVAGDPEIVSFGAPGTAGTSYSASADGPKALVVNNRGMGEYYYSSSTDPNKKVCLLIATGDVVVQQDFSGIIIARGTVTIENDRVNSITTNQSALYEVLNAKINSADPNSETVLEHFFRDGDKYVLGQEESTVTEGDYVTYSELITYEDWTKR